MNDHEIKNMDEEWKIEPIAISLIPEGDLLPTGSELRVRGCGAYRELIVEIQRDKPILAIGETYVGSLDVVADLLIDPACLPDGSLASPPDSLFGHVPVLIRIGKALRVRIRTRTHEQGGVHFATGGDVDVAIQETGRLVAFERLAFQVKAHDQVFGIIELSPPHPCAEDHAGLDEINAALRFVNLTESELEGFRSLLDHPAEKPAEGVEVLSQPSIVGHPLRWGFIKDFSVRVQCPSCSSFTVFNSARLLPEQDIVVGFTRGFSYRCANCGNLNILSLTTECDIRIRPEVASLNQPSGKP